MTIQINDIVDQITPSSGTLTNNGTVVDKSLNLQGGNNLLTQSQTLATSPWTFNSGGTGVTSVTQNATTAPDNTTTSNLLLASNTNTSHFIYSTVILTSGITYTYSVYAKAGTNNFLQLNFGGDVAFANFNLSTGVLGTYASCTPSIQLVGNGWYRCIVGAVTPTANRNPEINIANSASMAVNASWSAAGTETIYAWGAQLELGTVASAYTPTTTTAITTTNNISVPSGQVLVQNGSAALPSYSFGAYPTQGFRSVNSNTVLYGNNNSAMAFNGGNSSITLNSTGFFGFSPSTVDVAGSDTSLYRDAANTLAQRNSTNAQTFRLYNTYTDASNYERLSIDWSTTANTATIVTQNAGTGSARNLAIGQDLYVNTVRVGKGFGSINTNTAIGVNVLNSGSLTGVQNVGVGYQALTNNTSASNNTAVGVVALSANSTGGSNSAQGYNSLSANTTGSTNSAFGSNSLQSNTTGSNNTVQGYFALGNNTTASNLIAIGREALLNNTTNVATLGAITGGSSYTNGTYTGVVMTLSSGSTAITYPTATIVVASNAVSTVTITSAGVGFKDTTTVLTAPAASIGGTGSGFSVPVASLQSGNYNTAVGYQAGYTNTTGSSNTSIGYQSFVNNLTGGVNTAVGMYSLRNNTSGNNNTALGQGALNSSTTGSQNTAIGQAVLYSNTTGTNNIAIGFQAGYGTGTNYNTTGNNNTYIGTYTVGSAATNTNEMVIGYSAVGLGSNTTVIGNSSTTATTIYGSLTSTGVMFPQQATTAAAPAYVKGGMYFDTTLNKLRIGGATAWETVTSV